MAFRHPSRLIGLVVTAATFVLLQQSPATAVLVDGNPDARDPDRFEHIVDDMNCVGADALKSVQYTVDGLPVADLIGKVKPESTVKVTFELADACAEVQLGLATYNSVTQKLIDQEAGTFTNDAPFSLTLITTKCDFQISFFTGELLNLLSTNVNYSTPINRLIATGTGGGKSCDVAPVVASGQTTTSTTAAPATSSTTVAAVRSTSTTIRTSTTVEPPVEVASTSISRDALSPSPTSTTAITSQTTAHLPETGSDTTTWTVLGLGLLAVGALLSVAAAVKKRRR
jgi:LPXTG-motif cell wall-anchored protein